MNLLATTNQPLTMSSREIAELTGKRHDNVKRDINKMIFELKEDILKFEGIYTDSSNRQQVEYNLDRDHTDCLLTGYSSVLRMKVVKRWRELEGQQSPQIPTNFAEALQLAADQAKQLELQAPKVAFVDNLVDRANLLTATQIGQKHKLSAIKLNKILTELDVYNGNVKRGKVFKQWFVDKGYGEMKKTELGYDQPLFTNAGEIWINEQLHSEGIV